jgi:2-polyprenyl-3-methyl-5-hydroxy-6-metoxy-1,4-benzoquinol methylase
MDKFLPHDDELGKVINTAANELYMKMHHLDVDGLGMPEHCLYYFKTSHTKRIFFSIETSAHLLYRSIKLTGKVPAGITLMDYGAGVGTLFLLAKMIGCAKVVYNDHLDDWRKSAELIANAIGVTIDLFIVGDIGDCLNVLDQHNIKCDIIASRNVLEHIYKLNEFYAAIHQRQPHAIIFSSTTANSANPAAAIKHWLWHRKWEKVYRGKRLMMIERIAPGMLSYRKQKIARATRGLASSDLENVVDQFRQTGKLPDPGRFGSNTCDPSNGVWAENLLKMDTYRKLIDERFFNVSFAPGFWDTHYSTPYKNKITAALNRVIAKEGKLAMMLAPFIYVIATPKLDV